jgi:predicted small integral membrane protein
MSGFAWMAWTWQTALFFAAIASLLVVMTALAILRPETPRVGVLRFPTTRGDRLFIALLGAAFIHLAWVGLIGPSLWWAMAVSFVYAALVFRYV